jgi:hypothetical protein
LQSAERKLGISAIARREIKISEHRSKAAVDQVLVAPLAGGGIISYRRPDGSFLHTLNNQEGFERKLRQLGIDLDENDPL